jgi:hypothetical protein
MHCAPSRIRYRPIKHVVGNDAAAITIPTNDPAAELGVVEVKIGDTRRPGRQSAVLNQDVSTVAVGVPFEYCDVCRTKSH